MSPARRYTTVALLTSGLLTLLAACGADDPDTATGRHQDKGPLTLGHVHGLGIDPADDTLYAATHFGVFNLGEAGAGPVARVADRWQDTMAFTVVGPNHFLASGHPDQREDLPVHLGLIESADAARTWEPVSLLGEADFHALEAAGDRVYGYDSVSSRLMVTEDRKEWRTLDQVAAADLAADPDDPGRVLASTAEGVITYRVEGGPGRLLDGTPPLLLLDWPAEDLLVGATGQGVVYRSSDSGKSWQRSDAPPGDLQALDVSRGGWYIATSGGLFRSSDDGRSWQALSVG